MKKIFAFIALIMVLVSCKPKQTCVCTYTASGSTHSMDNDIMASTRKQAQRACDNFKEYVVSQGYKDVSCSLR
ncbi:MAG: hypothetical protein KF744_00320 [Taibaiella sp.]|nr:hypothetical protein [Taibaiella sp.]